MRLLLVNPNITAGITETMADEARRAASPGTTILTATAAFGTQYVATRPEAAIAGHAVIDAVAGFTEAHDAVVVAAFGDPGLAAAKELFDVPVVGIMEIGPTNSAPLSVGKFPAASSITWFARVTGENPDALRSS